MVGRTVGPPPTGGPGEPGSSSVTLHSSWSGIVLSVLGTAILVLIAVGIMSVAGGVVAVIAGLAAAGVIAIVLFDMPLASTFDRHGVVRRTPLRRHRLAWSDVGRVKRRATLRSLGFRGSVVLAPLRGGQTLQKRSTGGLVAITGRRHTLLTDRAEAFREYEAMLEAVGREVRDDVFFDLTEPPLSRKPTWRHRRARWRPDSADGR